MIFSAFFASLLMLCFFFSSLFSLLLQQVSDFDLFTLDDIDAAFQNVTRLTYSQNYHISGWFSATSLIIFSK